MVKGIKIILINFALILGLSSCNKLIPTGFWNNYQKDFLKKNISDQGTNGGHRAMYWKAEKQGTFISREIIGFAEKNGWEFVDSLEIQADELKTWYYNNTAVFPLSYTGFSKTPTSNKSECEWFPRWINVGLKVYQFKTGWIAYDPGTDNSIDENGFVILNIDGNEMSVYHLWGE